MIAPQITLWNQQGSEVIQGNLLVIPIEESLLYIRPLYLRAAGGRIPELKRVVVAHQNHIVMEETLNEALERLFPASGATQRLDHGAAAVAAAACPSEPGSANAPSGGGSAALEAQRHYERAIEAQRAGDWARYGEEIRQLGETLKRLNAPPPAPPRPTSRPGACGSAAAALSAQPPARPGASTRTRGCRATLAPALRHRRAVGRARLTVPRLPEQGAGHGQRRDSAACPDRVLLLRAACEGRRQREAHLRRQPRREVPR